MLNSIKSKTKKILCCLILCLGILASAFVNFNFSQELEVLANATNKITEDVTASDFGSGYNFQTSGSSTKPVSPSGWSALDSQSFNSKNIVSGIVNIEDETSFDTDECKTTRPSMPIKDKDAADDPAYYQNLMINSHNGSGRYGYSSSKTISLQANSFYRISVYLYTQKSDAILNEDSTDAKASIYLDGLLDKNDEKFNQTKFEYITTLGAWEEYYFYIDTNEAKTAKIELWLGSKDSDSQGAVFFNNIRIIRYSEDAYYEQTSGLVDEQDDEFNIISLSTTKNRPVENSSFEDVSLNGWSKKIQSTSSDQQLFGSVDVNTFSKVNEDLTITPPGSNCTQNNQNALFMYNKVDGYQLIESSETFTIEKQTYYKLSFWAKSNCNTGSGATVMLVDKSEENPAASAKLTLATTFSTDSNKFRNNWTQYSFYIYGPAASSKEASIQIWLGTQESKTSGYVFIDDFTIEKIDYNSYSTNSSSANCTTFNLNNATDKYSVSNSDFNITQNSTSQHFYPATPASWSRTGDNNTTTLSGIVNTSKAEFDDMIKTAQDKIQEDEELGEYGSIIVPSRPTALPFTDTDDNNVLMIGSNSETNKSQTYSSNALTLAENGYYIISFYVMTDYTRNIQNENYGARVSISTANINIFDYYNLHFTDNNWHKFEIKIKVGSEVLNPTISLSFENTIGYVFFDKVELKTINETTYNDTTLESAEVNKYKIDLSKETFNNNVYNKVLTATDGIDPTVSGWEFSNSSEEVGVNNGIISANNPILNDVNTNSTDGDINYLYISSLHDGYYTYKSKKTFTFNSATYYKITVDVLTKNLSKQEEYETEENEDVQFGASIVLTDSTSILIKGINTYGVWKTYTIYASFEDSLTSSIELGLGYTNQTVSGIVLFDNIKVDTITKEIYEEEFQNANLDITSTFMNYSEPKPEPSNTSSPWKNEFNWFLIPSILTGIAIIIAIIGYYLRKITFNRKPKVKTNYDRRKTLDKDIDRREKIALRQQIIDELRAEIQTIDQEIADFNALANEQLQEIKEQITLEQEALQKQKLQIEIKKKEATAQREKQLKENPALVSNSRAEKEYNNFISKLDKQELSIQKKITSKEFKIETTKQVNQEKLSKFNARKEYIRLQIAKIEAEIEEIARQEEQIWTEYKAAKADAKRRKAEYKAQIKAEKEMNKKTTAKKSPTKATTKKQSKNSENENSKK